MDEALTWHEAQDQGQDRRSEDAARPRPTAPSRSRPAPASRTWAGRQSPASHSRGQDQGIAAPCFAAVPTHRLADEARSKMPDGVTVAIWQGREGTKLGTDEPMCRNLEAVKAAIKIGAEVEETAA